MRIAASLAILVGCSSAPPPAPPHQVTTVRPPVSSKPTCADMGPLLRGAVNDATTDGPKKEAAITAACLRDRWAFAVLDCVARATEPTSADCLDRLTPRQRADYATAIRTFVVEDREVQEELVSDTAPACTDALLTNGIDSWPPETAEEAQRPLARQLRATALVATCEGAAWSDEQRRCFAQTPVSGIDQCMQLLGAGAAEVTAALGEADALRAKITASKAASCDKVVATQLADARVKPQAPTLTGGARKTAIAALKKRMRETCQREWSVDARACLVVAPDDPRCFTLAASRSDRWVLTAASKGTGIAECDAYAAAVERLIACDKIPAETRQQMRAAFASATDAWKDLPAESVAAAAGACKAATHAIEQAMASCT